MLQGKNRKKSLMANNFHYQTVGGKSSAVNEILQKESSWPACQGVAITDVQTLGDLSMAKVYYGCWAIWLW